MRASEYLAAARDEIEAGWTTGTLQDHMSRVCSVGALARVSATMEVNGLDDFTEVCEAGNQAATALEMVVKELGGDGASIIGYNDSHDKDAVLMAFDKAIASLEERGE